ncbi:helix-turn-helix domain-containing protein [Kutzneria buriramensis]|uniref:Helix-turn-helix protein n=1 Tax=Kutzneria buriramensis TaxID=1045776 RepID=A0A3E0GW21_9PSEU|nr:helix-turn-helix transcriptional regulator [Kutzneria buriramensis]REH30703.1 helix-turn-helix protein [Kutzneria buriramensis]
MPKTEINSAPSADAAPALRSELRALRVASGLSLRDLAAKINYSHVTIHKAETNVRQPSWAVVEKIVNACAPPGENLAWWQGLWKAAGPRTEEQPMPPTPSAPASPPTHATARRRRHGNPARAIATCASLSADPNAIRTVRDYIGALRSLRMRSYREVARRAAKALSGLDQSQSFAHVWRRREKKPEAVASSTLADLFRPDRRWLDWRVIRAFLLGCDVPPADLPSWERLLHRVQGYSRPVPVHRTAPHAPPPAVDLTGIDTIPAFIAALKELMRKAGKTMATAISDARCHPGVHIPGRSTVAARFSRGINHGELPERDLVKAFLRGAYCGSGWPRECVPDCNADEIAAWMRRYDDLWRQNMRRR